MDKRNSKYLATALDVFSEQIVRFEPELISKRALQTVKFGVADTVGVTLAGISEPCTQILFASLGLSNEIGDSLIVGTRHKASALDATLINGIASHALDFDDFSDVLGGHQSVPLVPALLALAQNGFLSGLDFVNAYVVGLEAEHRFAEALNPTHYDKGWHPTSTLGIFGTAAAAAWALKLNQHQTATALAIASSLASGIKANFGTMTKPLHVGHSGRSGLLAAFLARNSFTANHQALEHKQGFLDVFNGLGSFNIDVFFENRQNLAIDLPTLGIKQYPCCGSTHPAIYAVTELKRAHEIDAAKVEKITIYIHARRLQHTNNPRPKTTLEAKFSLQYVVVKALVADTIGLKDFQENAFLNPKLQELLGRVNALPFGAQGAPDGEPWDAEVVVALKSGKTVRGRVNNMVGRSGANAMSVPELKQKFDDCADGKLTNLQRDHVFELFMNLEAISDLTQLFKGLEGSFSFSAISHIQEKKVLSKTKNFR